jgi:transcriptional regulator with XRE-family HTH domain
MGGRLRTLRQERGLTLGDVARSLGVTTACVCQWEAGKSYPKPQFWPDLARTIGTTVSYLIAGEDLMAGEDEALRMTRRVPEEVIQRARNEIAAALGLEISKVRIEVDAQPDAVENKH